MYLSLIYDSYFKNKRKIKISIILFFFKLIRYKDNSYAKNFENKNFVIKYYYFINGAIIS